jgi:hypothetical protein
MSGSISAREILLTVSLVAGLVAAPGQALADVPVANEQSAESVSSTPSQKVKPSAATKYCVVEEGTGSRIPKKVCRTKAQWDDLGVELPSK